MLKFADIFIPKGNGLGWTLDFENPLSWFLLILIFASIFYLAKSQIKELISIVRGYFKK